MKKNRSRILGLWSGSSPASRKELNRGLKHLKKLGLKAVSVQSNLRSATQPESGARRFLAGSDQQKVQALHKLLIDKNVQDILCVRGGYGTLRLLEHLDKLNIKKKNTKRIWGFSDQTTLQNYLYLKWGMSWVHSPMLSSNSFTDGSPRERAPWTAKGAPSRNVNLRAIRGSPKKRLPKSATILGGNLTCLSSLLALRSMRAPKTDFVLFLEDVSERAYRLDRMLVMLKYSGFLKTCRAIFLGYFTDCPNWLGVFEKFAQEAQIPVYLGMPAGHDRPNIALPMGEKVVMTPTSKNFGTLKVQFPKLQIRG